ncbi:hypothetical protein BDZ94DRAFT_1269959 [Collybia nuda]|uniref:Poly A polymerase head domain-containing protein n=1 Tax=Collybia nuda TaxID=64659 RepID=A0A9P6CF75_9AGAR|nr:hypothetical protein BDZ94DRAFT_1269959 [Collybia nuda]
MIFLKSVFSLPNTRFLHRRSPTIIQCTMSLKARSMPRIDIPTKMKIELTSTEEEICALLNDCTNHLAEKGINTTCRIAGGWVRDKLLGSQSHDIDIALSDIMGLPFAEHLAGFAESKGIKTGSISKIAQNPDRSKHLETATFKFLGLDIDLVNLRSEEYADSSRIPTEVTFGTPLQDALRRDTTINALFYNIHTHSVEDFTGKGLEDLRNGIIRTPLPPRETFLDDPLRILRCIRFASRYGFKIVLEAEEAAKDPVIQNALMSKVARERAGEELSKMLKGRDPLLSICLIHKLSLYHSIFSVIPEAISSTFSAPPSASDTSLSAANILHALLHPAESPNLPVAHPTLFSRITNDTSCISRLYLAAALTPYRNVTYMDQKRKTQKAVEFIIRESLKLGVQNHFLDGVPSLFAAARLLQNPALDQEKFRNPSERVAIGLLLREKVIHNHNTGSHWTTSLLFSLVQELVPYYDSLNDKLDTSKAASIIELYNAFVNRIEELDLLEMIDAKPLLDGHEVVEASGATKSGAWTGKVMTKILAWQLDNPGATKDTCRSWLGEERREGRLVIAEETTEPVCKRARTR